MADAQDKGDKDDAATDSTGAKDGQDAPKTDKADKKVETFTAEQVAQKVESEADRRVAQMQATYKKEHDAIIANAAKSADEKIAALTAQSKKQTEESQARIDEAEMKANFAQDAHESGIQSMDAAFLVASAKGYIKGGRLQLAKFKEDYPLFFATKSAQAHAGEGTDQTNATSDPNAALRILAG